MKNLSQLPNDLPVPQDDGAADHLVGMALPAISLSATTSIQFPLSKVKGRLVIYCYPMTGQPNVALPDGWDQIPGARGCTPQSCAFRDHYQELRSLGAEVVGLSVQSTEYQQEMADRLHLPFPVLSDDSYLLQRALQLPTFVAAGMTLLKRLTLIVNNGVIEVVHYPIFPSDSDPEWVVNYLKNNPA
ncbi:peroxiredoxin [Polynucleobacter sp. UK-Mo-2m-Kol15]|uniref:peroxiredoxin n=1 Tax=Polynucleobacter sp. UK-Mo-2m-Kol15 TaxID=2576916 RepID=UPI001C0B3443|nr:peroxiredoxin [Polynucleobacter sp. UK-Mo-2m-Kol15]MBU3574425.1 peroxiredoxin [Polynucleobacter sp. UK-Mo-2m-Kol15]